uniref:Uncharacterized protein n=1 Tax=Arundo donax TaxID=35708 RepID=A0A0A8Z8J2_ARUDO
MFDAVDFLWSSRCDFDH